MDARHTADRDSKWKPLQMDGQMNGDMAPDDDGYFTQCALCAIKNEFSLAYFRFNINFYAASKIIIIITLH